MDSLTNPLNYSQQLCQSNQYFIKLLYFSDICFLCKKAIVWKVRKLCGIVPHNSVEQYGDRWNLALFIMVMLSVLEVFQIILV